MDTQTQRQWIGYTEAAQYTGLGRTTLTHLVKSGELRAAKVGKRVLIARESIDSYLESQTYTEITQQ